MAANTTSSPVLSNNDSDTSANTVPSTPPPPPPQLPPSSGGALPTIMLQRSEAPKSLRGLNKPKCIKCGNVARSRCPYQSCKNCCAKAQNPCHIHVLKPNSTLADRGAAPNTAAPDQQPSEPPSTGHHSVKPTSFRHLSNAFAQFNNVHAPSRSRKQLTRKEALTLNEWRFAKLKEYKDANIEAENEAFDRYMNNISLLQEVFDVNSDRREDDSLVSNPPTTSRENPDIISETKVILRSNPNRIETFRKRIRLSIDQGMKKLKKYNPISEPSSADNEGDPARPAAKSCWAGKTLDLTELNSKLNRARNEEDLKHCIEMRPDILGPILEERSMEKDLHSDLETDISLKLVRSTEVDEDTLNSMNSHFSSLEEIEDL